ncbi:hypothetical protein PoB_006882300 [Plakobranchus ocellatus]|uniref:Uncharacterized protein n=1 Tax=Plakobranchus ocellatus TaxID=259542 RepID=A0AAV4DDH7_9GAST|nr:hypothetical protein PoB_006882300 [Plakobranchus ocellatus]
MDRVINFITKGKGTKPGKSTVLPSSDFSNPLRIYTSCKYFEASIETKRDSEPVVRRFRQRNVYFHHVIQMELFSFLQRQVAAVVQLELLLRAESSTCPGSGPGHCTMFWISSNRAKLSLQAIQSLMLPSKPAAHGYIYEVKTLVPLDGPPK